MKACAQGMCRATVWCVESSSRRGWTGGSHHLLSSNKRQSTFFRFRLARLATTTLMLVLLRCCADVVVVVAEPTTSSTIPCSSSHRGSSSLADNSRSSVWKDEDGCLPWNPSPKIDANGFLKKTYTCIPGDWEAEANIGGKHGYQSASTRKLSSSPVVVRQVPGDGNCLFHSIASALDHATTSTLQKNTNDLSVASIHNINGPQYDLTHWKKMSHKLRLEAVHILSSPNKNRILFLQGKEYMCARDLVAAAAAQYNLTGEDYCRFMAKDCYWGGGPEIVALCNALKRPIHVYELSTATITNNSDKKRKSFQLKRMACFGSPKFDKNEPLHILSADGRFPDLVPGRQLASGNHFLALFPNSIWDGTQLTRKTTRTERAGQQSFGIWSLVAARHRRGGSGCCENEWSDNNFKTKRVRREDVTESFVQKKMGFLRQTRRVVPDSFSQGEKKIYREDVVD